MAPASRFPTIVRVLQRRCKAGSIGVSVRNGVMDACVRHPTRSQNVPPVRRKRARRNVLPGGLVKLKSRRAAVQLVPERQIA